MSEAKAASEKEHAPEFTSKLKHGRERFLVHVIEHGLANESRTFEDFIRHFSAASIMKALADHPPLRANILVISTGTKTKVALKKSVESASEDLQIALDENETDAETIVTLFDPDDRVRYLDAKLLWAYVTESKFWQNDKKTGPAADRARRHLAYMLDRALADELITHRDIVEGVSVAKLAELLPREELERVIAAALVGARAGLPFTEADLLGETPPATLVKHLPLQLIWEGVIGPKVAAAHGFVDKAAAGKQPTLAGKPTDAKAPAKPGAPVPSLGSPKPLAKSKVAKSGAPVDLEVDFDLDEDTSRVGVPEVRSTGSFSSSGTTGTLKAPTSDDRKSDAPRSAGAK